MTNILAAMRERASVRATKWKNIKLKDLPDPFQLTERAILGSYSYTLQINRIRLLRKYSLLKLGEGIEETPSTVARDYLILNYKRSPRITHSQAIGVGAYDTPEDPPETKNLKPYPLYAKPATFEHGLYIDIKSTFWSILLIAGWNVDYYPGQWLAGGRAPSDFPFPNHKQARSCLVSVCRPGEILFFVPGKSPPFESHRGGNPVVNLSISKLISDILNSIARNAVDLGAVYANTDGYIAPTERKAAAIAQMIIDCGLEPRIKYEGKGSVKGIGAYRVGDYESEPFKIRSTPEGIENIYPPDYKNWLLPRFARLAAYCKMLDR